MADSIDSSVLRQLFEVHGAAHKALINRHLETGRGTGVGIVEMETEEAGVLPDEYDPMKKRLEK